MSLQKNNIHEPDFARFTIPASAFPCPRPLRARDACVMQNNFFPPISASNCSSKGTRFRIKRQTSLLLPSGHANRRSARWSQAKCSAKSLRGRAKTPVAIWDNFTLRPALEDSNYIRSWTLDDSGTDSVARFLLETWEIVVGQSCLCSIWGRS